MKKLILRETIDITSEFICNNILFIFITPLVYINIPKALIIAHIINVNSRLANII
ncbi:hypothetical protein D3C73_1434000 [compost metagenome]